MMFVSYVYCYMIIFVFDFYYDIKGFFYLCVLMYLFVGLYVVEICLIGFFVFKVVIGFMMLMFVFFIFIGFVYFLLSLVFMLFLYNLFRMLVLEKDIGE